jgi:predicted MFS family arabinose efflux permease
MQPPAHPLAASAVDRDLVGRYIFAGLCASLVSIGLARFAYTPLIPALIHAQWFSVSDVIYLGAANLAGYLVGAVAGRPMTRWLSNVQALRLMMLLATASFVACAFPLSVGWFFGWRLMSGVAGGAIMVLVAATVLPHVPQARRGLASGAIFLGIGLGVLASGTMVPLLLKLGLQATWIGLAVVSAVLTATSWFAWPSSALASVEPPAPASHAALAHFGRAINVLYVQYALMAVALVPSMVFVVDFIARGLGAGTHAGSVFWILYGVGAVVGPPLYGLAADRLGARRALQLVLWAQAAASAGFFISKNHALLALLTIVAGTFPPGSVPLVLARVRELIPHDAHKQNMVWSRATTLYAAALAASGYAYSAIFNASAGSYRLLFLVATATLAFALLAELASLARKTSAHIA